MSSGRNIGLKRFWSLPTGNQRSSHDLRVFFEASGKHEDRDLMTYIKALKADGMSFADDGAHTYALASSIGSPAVRQR